MATQWTPQQKQAIENRGGTLLVSAAAGSGKTAVLVERVLRRLTAAEPVNIDQFLMVTYTNAAAAELRAKIADALTAQLAQEPEDARIRRQLLLVQHAQITTVHAFCLKLAREQFAALGIAPDFRIADTGEGDILKEEVLDEVLEQHYQAGHADFLALSDLLTSGREDIRLHQTVLETYEKIQAHPRPQAYLEQTQQALLCADIQIADTPHGAVLLQEAELAVKYALSCLEDAIEQMQADEELVQNAYLPAFSSDKSHAEELLTQIQTKNWDGAVTLTQTMTFDKLKAVRGYEDKAHLEDLKALREEWKAVIKKLQEKVLCITQAQAQEDSARMSPAMSALIELTLAFSQAYSVEKRRRNLVDFGDLEHFAIALLTDDAGQPTALAHTLSAQFVEVLVDEYQDTNAVQDTIFRAVSDGASKLFMVGDVKQSIYSFRLANPYLFLSKYRDYADAEQAQQGQPRRVVLSKNFRSRAQVLDSVNTIFKAILCRESGELDYDEREMLYLGADFPHDEKSDYRTEICVINCDGDLRGTDKTMCEARVIAARIAQLTDGSFQIYDKQQMRAAQPSDCTILLRSVKQKADIFRKALEERGLTARTDDREGLLTTTEVRVMVSLLFVIDNPRQDIELIGVLRSPLFGFTEQQLAEIRLVDTKSCFYQALQQYTAPMAEAFLENLSRWRMLAADLSVCQLVQLLYDETNALGIYGAQPNGAQRQANLLAFFERARAFEGQGYRGIFRFMGFVRAMLENGEDFAAVQTENGGGAVRIMSIHKSKGLEFPIVFLADCAKSFNERDLHAPVLIHEALGFGAKCRDLERGIQYPTLQRLAIMAKARREQISEEMRVLYVGLTRARDKLIVTCASASAMSSLKKWARLAQKEQIPPYALGAARTTALWLLTPLLSSPAAQSLREMADISVPLRTDLPDSFVMYCDDASKMQENNWQLDVSNEQPPQVLLDAAPELTYENEFLQNIPAKLTATAVKDGFKAEEAAEGTIPIRLQEKTFRRPYFDKQKRGLTASEKGTAHHLFMQFCDFAACQQPNGIAGEIKRLRDKHILSQQQADAVRIDRIAAFFASPLYQQIMQQGQVRREFKFSIVAPAAQFYPQAQACPEETVLLQGVIDCLIETEHEYIIIDFKTDYVTPDTIAACADKYRPQLEVYAYAVTKIFEKPANRKELFFFAMGKSVTVQE